MTTITFKDQTSESMQSLHAKSIPSTEVWFFIKPLVLKDRASSAWDIKLFLTLLKFSVLGKDLD